MKTRGPSTLDPHLICHIVAGNVNSCHLHGLSENMKHREFCLDEAMRYIWGDVMIKAANAEFGKEEYHLSNQEIRGREIYVDFDEHMVDDSYHRSGWPFVIDGLMHMHARRNMRKPHLFLDLYVDRTFHWGSKAYAKIGRIPYKRPWIGIIHHTFDPTSTHNVQALFDNADFIESLKVCRCLVVLTFYIYRTLRVKLDAIGFEKLRVEVLTHPTQLSIREFNIEEFLVNSERKVVQVGSWLRDFTAIGLLALDTNSLSLTRAILDCESQDTYTMRVCGMHSISNKKMIQEPHDVSIINKLSNDEYDSLLSRNIVFLKLRDCSAVNTVLECIARKTPIVLNRHPALEEALGSDYPGFYEDLSEASVILNSISSIHACHEYLAKMDTTKFSIGEFVGGIKALLGVPPPNPPAGAAPQTRVGTDRGKV